MVVYLSSELVVHIAALTEIDDELWNYKELAQTILVLDFFELDDNVLAIKIA